jgi:hypothetical protein
MRTLLRPLLFSVLLAMAAAVPATAADKGLFINARWGDTDNDLRLGDTFEAAINGDSDYRAVEVGWRFSRLLAFQVGYHDFDRALGEASQCSGDVCALFLEPVAAETTAFSVSLAPEVALTKSVDLFGKVGVVAWDTDITDAASELGERIANFSDEELLYGVGVRLFLIAGLSISYELEWFGSDIKTQAFGASNSF